MDAAATAWAEVAERTGAAVLLVHHVRKLGAGAVARRGVGARRQGADRRRPQRLAAEPDDGRGGRAARRARRASAGATSGSTTPRPTSRRAPRSALWYRLESVALGNAHRAYPPATRWRRSRRGSRPARSRAAAGRLQRGARRASPPGRAPGQLFAAQRGGFGANERWAGNVLVRFGLAPGEAARVIAAWLRSGLLIETEYRDPVHRTRAARACAWWTASGRPLAEPEGRNAD